jgi:hypothetical protein
MTQRVIVRLSAQTAPNTYHLLSYKDVFGTFPLFIPYMCFSHSERTSWAATRDTPSCSYGTKHKK